ncbi:hypothetical protein [Fusibacter sp. 3D3]|uniref:hypothetical protein n=1 Tax=Fusibacter sp. 3D3 TaxID=1048380 RepID=UPI000852A344|nr:hypothetical protein [Fusibacter sp. 3D3]GAU79420.1 hypothetical protein F3D3_4084 [Fusibacter sp. 3D3]
MFKELEMEEMMDVNGGNALDTIEQLIGGVVAIAAVSSYLQQGSPSAKLTNTGAAAVGAVGAGIVAVAQDHRNSPSGTPFIESDGFSSH